MVIRPHGWGVGRWSLLVAAALLVPALAGAEEGGPADSTRASTLPSRNLLRDIGGGFATLGSDAWAVASSPGRLDRTGLTWALGTAAVTAVVYHNDEGIQRAMRRQHGNGVYDAALKMGENLEPLGYMGRTAPYYLGTLALGYGFRNRILMTIPGEIIESHVIAGGLRNVAKVLIGRRRPFEGQGSRAFEFDGGTSFPSGHASIAFELATILSEHAQRWPVTVGSYALATTVLIQRVDSGNHWPSDVLVPAVTGTFIARTVVRRHGDRAWALVPVEMADGEPVMAVVLRF